MARGLQTSGGSGGCVRWDGWRGGALFPGTGAWREGIGDETDSPEGEK